MTKKKAVKKVASKKDKPVEGIKKPDIPKATGNKETLEPTTYVYGPEEETDESKPDLSLLSPETEKAVFTLPPIPEPKYKIATTDKDCMVCAGNGDTIKMFRCNCSCVWCPVCIGTKCPMGH